MAISELGSELWRILNKNSDDLHSQTRLIKNQLSKNPHVSALLTRQLAIQNPGDFIESLLNIVRRWSFAALHIPKLQKQVVDWLSFKTPAKKDFNNLVDHAIHIENQYPAWAAHQSHLRRRDGFALTDKRFNQR